MTDLRERFEAGFSGELVTTGDADYDRARGVWNGMVNARPVLIARCRTAEEIASAIVLTRESGVPLAVRGGGHSVAGLSTCDAGVVIDLSQMRSVGVDADRRIATVEPGATWADFDAATARYELASTGGLISSTGVAGLTLGGGIGWLQRKYGLACDNLVAADLITASGETIRASRDERPDLLWGLRGGGGNFGVVTQFQFALHPVSTVLGGMMLFGFERASEVLHAFRDWTATLPDEASMLAAVMTAPPEPFVPPHLVGQKAVAIVGCWCGEMDEGASQLAPMRRLQPEADVFGPIPYPALQRMLDGSAPAGVRNYFRGGYLSDLTDEVITAVVDHGGRLPSPMSAIHLHHMGGAVGRVGIQDTAFNGRAAGYTYNLVSTWVDATEDQTHVAANRELAAALAPLSQPGTYVNFLSDAGTNDGGARTAYGDDVYNRLARLKREFDPANLFSNNHNVRPAR